MNEGAAQPRTPTPRPPRSPSAGALAGRRLGDFQIVRLLGEGGMGEVYLAEQISLQRPVALKVLRQDLLDDESYLHRFEAEAKAVAPIHHPNIVSVYAIGEEEGVRYIALEYVQGMNLRDYLNRKGPLEPSVFVNVLRKVAAALEAAAERDIVHRDIKPDNVLITKKGEVKVADFGLARQTGGEELRLTQTGVTMGTPLYMSPEQLHGQQVDGRSDVYSLGVMSYHMLAGRPPFHGETAVAVALQHVSATPTPLEEIRPDVPVELCRLVERMMAKSAADRPQTPAEILRELQRLKEKGVLGSTRRAEIAPDVDAATPPKPLEPPRPPENPPRNRSRLATALLAATALVLAILAGTGVGRWSARQRMGRAVRIPAPAAVPPDLSSVREFRTGALQLLYAHSTNADKEREKRLWAVLDFHPGDETETISAGIELFRGYLGRREYDAASLVAQALIECDDHQQRMVGYLFRGVVDSRRGKSESSNESFLKMLSHERPAALDPAQVSWLAQQYFLSLDQNAERLGVPRQPEMVKKFWASFLPRAPARPGRG